VRATHLEQARAGALEHESDADVGFAQAAQIVRTHHPGIRMRKEAGLFQHQLAHRGEVFERSVMAQLFQERFRFRKNTLGLIAQAEQRLFASGAAPSFGYGENLIRQHVGGLARLRVRPESAVTAIVAAQVGERNENFPRIADRTALGAVAHGCRCLQQGLERARFHQAQRVFPR
jgi:hypothetical protein